LNQRPIIIKGRQSCRRGDGILGNHTPADEIFRWAGSMNDRYHAKSPFIVHISPVFLTITPIFHFAC
jgi:hypothetical protein